MWPAHRPRRARQYVERLTSSFPNRSLGSREHGRRGRNRRSQARFRATRSTRADIPLSVESSWMTLSREINRRTPRVALQQQKSAGLHGPFHSLEEPRLYVGRVNWTRITSITSNRFSGSGPCLQVSQFRVHLDAARRSPPARLRLGDGGETDRTSRPCCASQTPLRPSPSATA